MIKTEQAHLTVVATSHPGIKGKNNEDRYGVTAFRLEEESGKRGLLAVVADGIGGHRAGEVAAELAVETISRQIAASDGRQPLNALEQAIVSAGEEIYRASAAHPGQSGMGATCACVLIIADRLYLASVGDTRVYLRRENDILQLTTDHTWVQDAIDQGVIQPEQARNHPNAHVIRRYLGSAEPVKPDFRLRLEADQGDMAAEENQGLRLQPGEIVLLCSDGLTDLVDDHEIQRHLGEADLEIGLNALVELANQRGGHDNITLVALRMPRTAPASISAPPPTRKRILRPTCIWAAVFMLFTAAVLGGVYLLADGWFRANLQPAGSGDSPPILISSPTSGLPVTQPVLDIPPVQSSPVITSEPFTPFVSATDIPTGSTPTPIPTRLDYTLTPWPTNTPAPE